FGLLRTEHGLTPSLDAGTVLTSLVLYMVAYTVIFGFGLIYILRVIRSGPSALVDDRTEEAEPALGVAGQPVPGGDD
ncbi:MAG: cytochrome ubiquinol oxidase subunit I, partial [Geminicoccaceae bacterium]|nr:cytochrome ubiquinol oxidase subunit I [Geminicoccaceae bacterium]